MSYKLIKRNLNVYSIKNIFYMGRKLYRLSSQKIINLIWQIYKSNISLLKILVVFVYHNMILSIRNTLFGSSIISLDEFVIMSDEIEYLENKMWDVLIVSDIKSVLLLSLSRY